MSPRKTQPTLLLLLLAACAPAHRPRGAANVEPVPVTTAAPRVPGEKLLGLLPKVLALPGEREPLSIFVDLRRQADLGALASDMDRRRLPRRERRPYVIAALRAVAADGARTLEPLLSELKAKGEVESYRGHVIVSRYWVVAAKSAVLRLAEEPEVDAIRWADEQKVLTPDRQGRAPDSQDEEAGLEPLASPDPFAWAPEAIGATRLWEMGLSGAGVVVASLDSGVDLAHEQLRDGYRGGAGSWLDPMGGTPEPRDPVGHGTGVLACAVGRNPRGTRIGVAPGATWVAANVFHEGSTHPVPILAAADWVLTVAAPDVVVNPWMRPGDSCDPFYERVLGVWRLAEIFAVFAAGNAGPRPGVNHSPSNTMQVPPDGAPAFSVGASARAGRVADLSSRGPSRCGGGIFPQVCAPGYMLRTAQAGAPHTYHFGWGSSYAAGVAGGAAALLVQAYPEAPVRELEAALRETAKDIGPSGPDNDCGYGLIDLPAALDWLRARHGRPHGGSKR